VADAVGEPSARRAPAALLVTAALLAGLLGGCSLAGRTFGTYIDDASITGSVKLRLVGGNPRALRRVNVDTFGGTVYLSGLVDTPEQKSDAEIAAWRTPGVEQVVNDLRVLADRPVSALPRLPETGSPTALQRRLPGIARLDAALPGAPALAYDREGAVVATVYVRPLREVMGHGVRALGPTTRPITHVALYPVLPGGEQPEALITVVLWHVSRAAAAALEEPRRARRYTDS
jgi:hypothetical protein